MIYKSNGNEKVYCKYQYASAAFERMEKKRQNTDNGLERVYQNVSCDFNVFAEALGGERQIDRLCRRGGT